MTKKIVVLGAGFAGLKATRTLSKELGRKAEITLIDRHSYHTMMTQLHEVAAGRVPFTNAQYDLGKILGKRKNVKIVTDTVTTIDKEAKIVKTSNGEYNYDYILIAIGGEPNDFGVPGVKEHAFTLWSMEDALRIKRHLEEVVQTASTELDADKRKALLNISVAGSGFTGIEMMGELIEWRDVVAKDWKLDPKEFTLNVVEMMPTILNMLDRKQADRAKKYMEKKGVNILTEHAISEVQPDRIKIKDGEDIPTRTLIWTTGVQGNTQAASYELAETERGHRLQANEYMEAIGYEGQGVYVAGDVSGFVEPKTGRPTPQIVEAAEQTGHAAAENILADITGNYREKVDVESKGTMVSIGGRYGVAYLFGSIRLSGFLAMAVKNFTYILYTLQIGSLWYFFTYLKNEIFHTPHGRNLMRGHTSRLANVLWALPLRIFYGVVWLMDAWPKVFGNAQDSWMTSQFRLSFASWAAPQAADTASGASTAAAGASTAVSAGASEGVASTTSQYFSLSYVNGKTPMATEMWGWLKPILKVIIPNTDTALFLQKAISIVELLLGLAIIFGAFTFLASGMTAVLTLMFVSTGFFYWVNIWYVFVAIALMGGAGRAMGLDYWIQPFVQKYFFRFWYAKSSSIYPANKK